MKEINDEILSVAMQRLHSEILSEALKRSITPDLLSDGAFGYPLRVYVLLTYMLASAGLDVNLSGEDLFYNRYLWFTRFARLKEQKCGYDAGVNQQSIRLLEEIDVTDLKIDWDVMQRISDTVELEMSRL